ncbi:MAG: T9SS type A sorting domain-containing protein, partial [Bacteroidetes bacterium]|nr:T9SS type A sorting domain-containing protein [Bacteroidota bacterium]
SLWFRALRTFQTTYKNSTASVIDFKNHYQTQTGINATQFFNQWYYGEGYPTFAVNYNFVGNTCYIKSTQSTSTPSSVPLFITPMEYKLTRTGAADTIVRVTHSLTVQNYSFNVTGTVTGVVCDPNNWIINKSIVTLDPTVIGIDEIGKEISEIFIGPNPTKGVVTVQTTSTKTNKVKVSDIQGKLLFERTFNSETSIDLSNYSNGTYFVKILDDSGNELKSKKVVKQ